MRRRILLALGLVLLAALAACGGYGWIAAEVAAGYAAKIVCGGVFVAGRDAARVQAEDLAFLPFISTEVDAPSRAVVARLGPVSRRAVFREGLGSVLVCDAAEADLRAATAPPPPALSDPAPDPRPWPIGDGPYAGTETAEVDRARLEAALDRAFSEPDPAKPRRTRAMVVLLGDRIVAERYAPGFDARTPLIGWSMTKSVLSALVGVAVREGRLRLDAPAGLPEWSAPGDPRAAITVEDLLRMRTGLAFDERYDVPHADAVQMLFRSADYAAYAAARPLEHARGTRWSYSSGTSNMLAAVLRRAFAGDDAAYRAFPRRALFDRIGMRSALVEADASGTLAGSSFSYATARDWARFGLLHLQDGVFGGERILPAGWVDLVRAPTAAARHGNYGGHFWLNAGPAGHPERRSMRSIPADMFFAAGFQEQYVAIIPSRRAVIVRLGLADYPNTFALEDLVRDVLAALPEVSAAR